MNVPLEKAILLAGPTAVGKSAVAWNLAQHLDAEILGVDSMQVYRGMDLGTAKPSSMERATVPHHMIDVADVAESFHVAAWTQCAREILGSIYRRGRIAILCGGTGLYFKALIEGLGDSPASDPGLRAVLERTAQSDLLAELQEKDPLLFDRIDRRNPRRVVRAVEVIRLTGRAYSEQQSPWRKKDGSTPGCTDTPQARMVFFGLDRAREDLRGRVEQRVDAMFANGLVAETERLMQRGLGKNRTASQALGYRQVIAFLRGECSLDETIALVKQRTWQFARRQMTWFRNQTNLNWIKVGAGESSKTVAARIEREWLQQR
ncbi:MAG: tRNA (adenosine(37)-N6)-dimethylallyltransferase MiaA [Verrucomicrobia bacterium]|nr:tRNA (adenosine(37)-N6)-dimethylallyltransferase MiaA [Verrucomicrobiota bacterium]